MSSNNILTAPETAPAPQTIQENTISIKMTGKRKRSENSSTVTFSPDLVTEPLGEEESKRKCQKLNDRNWSGVHFIGTFTPKKELTNLKNKRDNYRPDNRARREALEYAGTLNKALAKALRKRR